MRINLLHNKIVMDTISDKFIQSFNKNLLPKLEEKYPESEEVTLYEDYLSDGFMSGGVFFCPLTLVSGGVLLRAFASWRVDAKNFENSIPYSYRGEELLDFELLAEAPEALEKKIAARVPRLSGAHISLRIEADAPTKTFLSGKYSQSFVDIMAEALTGEIEKTFSIGDVCDSSLELRLVFAPESFMEHVADNVTYRRLLITARACTPRDLWIKWTRLDAMGTYTVSDHISPENILFEIAEDVPEKIREKEYRYLIAASSQSAYRNAMSRKNFTEWRELVKRVIKRGEVTKYESLMIEESFAAEEPSFKAEDLPEPPVLEASLDTADDGPVFDNEISLKLQSVLENYDVETDEAESDESEDLNPDITELLRGLISQERGSETELDMSDEEELPEEAFVQQTSEEENDGIPPFDIEESYEYDEGEAEEEENENTEDICSEAEKTHETEAKAGVEAEEAKEAIEEPAAEAASPFDALTAFDYDSIRNEENERIKREIEELKAQNESLLAIIKEREAERVKLLDIIEKQRLTEEENRRERETLREALEAKKRSEERERDRIAEAARIAVEEHRQKEADRPAEDTSKENNLEEELRIAEMKRLEEEALEAEKLRKIREAEEAERARLEAEKALAVKAQESVRYVSKVADIIFRRPVDPNITKRIQEIIVTTVKYFGKESIYMKIKASIPEPCMVRLDFVKIPENESALLTDIIRVLGHSKLGIAKVLLD